MSYRHGTTFGGLTDAIVDNDFHPVGREERARQWREEKAEAIAELNNLNELWPTYRAETMIERLRRWLKKGRCPFLSSRS
jgi:hypothetical protein